METISLIIAIFTLTFLGALGAYYFKKASLYSSGVVLIFFNKNVYLGGSLYFVSALLNIWVLKYLPYVLVLPLTSLTYVWTMIFSYYLLKEKVSIYKIFGVIFIILGTLFLGLGFK